MALKSINFSQQGEEFVSSAIQLSNGNVVIHLEFSGENAENQQVHLAQSITGSKFHVFDSQRKCVNGVYEKNVTGGMAGQYIKVICHSMPTLAQYLEEE